MKPSPFLVSRRGKKCSRQQGNRFVVFFLPVNAIERSLQNPESAIRMDVLGAGCTAGFVPHCNINSGRDSANGADGKS
jgi:hypothetical protein